MARTTVIELIDDISGSSDGLVETVHFALDGVTYEIDLGEDNAADLRTRLGEFTAKAKRIGGRIRKPSIASLTSPGSSSGRSSAVRSREQLSAIREWARRHGHTVAERGRVPQAILDAFDEDQRQPATVDAAPPRPTKRRARK